MEGAVSKQIFHQGRRLPLTVAPLQLNLTNIPLGCQMPDTGGPHETMAQTKDSHMYEPGRV